MFYKVLADLVLVLHLGFILFVLFGALLVIWQRWVMWVHLPALVWVVLLEFNGWICPLTPLENHWRLLAGDSGYPGGFIDHYLMPIIYPPGLTSDIQVLLGFGVLILNIGVYSVVLWKRRGKAGF